MNKLIDSFVEYEMYCRKSPSTIKNYKSTANSFLRDNNINTVEKLKSLDLDFFEEWQENLLDKVSASTVNKKVKQLSSFYNFLIHDNIVNENYLQKLPHISTIGLNDVEDVLSNEEIKCVLNTLKNKYEKSTTNNKKRIHYRNMLIINIEFVTGMRIEEISRIKIKDFNIEKKTLFVRGKGHGGKISRKVFLNKLVCDMITKYMTYRNEMNVADDYSDILFINEVDGKDLSTQSIRKMWYESLENANVRRVKFHSIRKVVGSILVDKGFEIEKVAKMLGQSKSTAERYYQRNTDELQEMSEANDEWFA